MLVTFVLSSFSFTSDNFLTQIQRQIPIDQFPQYQVYWILLGPLSSLPLSLPLFPFWLRTRASGYFEKAFCVRFNFFFPGRSLDSRTTPRELSGWRWFMILGVMEKESIKLLQELSQKNTKTEKVWNQEIYVPYQYLINHFPRLCAISGFTVASVNRWS